MDCSNDATKNDQQTGANGEAGAASLEQENAEPDQILDKKSSDGQYEQKIGQSEANTIADSKFDDLDGFEWIDFPTHDGTFIDNFYVVDVPSHDEVLKN